MHEEWELVDEYVHQFAHLFTYKMEVEKGVMWLVVNLMTDQQSMTFEPRDKEWK
jgi:hypothetical protein